MRGTAFAGTGASIVISYGLKSWGCLAGWGADELGGGGNRTEPPCDGLTVAFTLAFTSPFSPLDDEDLSLSSFLGASASPFDTSKVGGVLGSQPWVNPEASNSLTSD